ncbi:cupin domain-containing protein [Chryseolinea lacunae]|uniref:Cupin domain-containing protein n=1 Tax=Chryseolinea lacunae TaxID=2801331 RepID=A0ABS1KMY4_9BACT|nr:cupin domain-containing protein [Chryseolinea lacunae]MBL0740814.1 cupin domain-containing protein [Chryseolinea lacunae]
MTLCKSMLAAVFFIMLTTAQAQHHEKTKEAQGPLLFSPVLSQVLSDPELADFKMESTVLTVVPGGVDTVSHRHDCELFGYVMEGEVEIALVTKQLKKYGAGQMFYEPRNILHTYTHNASTKKPAKILLIFIIKKDRQGYTPEYVPAEKH